MSEVRILIVSDDQAFRSKAENIIDVSVVPIPEVKQCTSLMGTQNVLEFLPNIIIIEIDSMSTAKMAEYVNSLSPKHSVPIIVCSVKSGIKFAMMNAGAIDVITIPADSDAEHRFEKRFSDSIRRTVSSISVNTVNNVLGNYRNVIAIGGSTGSTEALRQIVKKLPKGMPPMAAVLHMPEVYTAIYAKQLNDITPFDVVEAKSGIYLRPGQLIIGAGGKHLRIFYDKKGYFVTSEAGVKVSGHCPSVDVFFESVACSVKRNAVGVILTGMGSDGAKGMLTMKKNGAYNIGQDEKSSVVYGMPKAAYDLGAVDKQCSLDGIVAELSKYALY